MKAEIQRLRAEVRSDLDAFRGYVDRLSGFVLTKDSAPTDLTWVAVALHHAYCAIESALERIVRVLEGSLPTSANYHQALLDSAALEIPSVRPAILSGDTHRLLRRLLSFRHFFRHAYAAPLDFEQLSRLMRVAEDVAPLIAQDLDGFDAFARSLGHEAERS